jgi:2-iminobutanoate/2-iminopropanoate deaminase
MKPKTVHVGYDKSHNSHWGVFGFLLLALLPSASFGSEPAGDSLTYCPASMANGMHLPFSDAVKLGNILFVSGQIGTVPGTRQLVKGGIDAEARQALENIKAILIRNGTSLDHVAKCTVFLADIGEWEAFNRVYVSYFGSHLPARSAMAASGLVLGARVEIECIALVPTGKR